MNALEIMMYGQRTVFAELDHVPQEHWERGGVCGFWSVKNIIAHLTSHEHVLGEVLGQFAEPNRAGAARVATPYLDEIRAGPAEFNDHQVEMRQHLSAAETLAGFERVHSETMRLLALVSPELLRRVGTIPWYGNEYALDDFIVYGYYGHKREHSAQIGVFKDLLAAEAGAGPRVADPPAG